MIIFARADWFLPSEVRYFGTLDEGLAADNPMLHALNYCLRGDKCRHRCQNILSS